MVRGNRISRAAYSAVRGNSASNIQIKVTDSSGNVTWVPAVSGNADYARVQAWVSAGGVITNA